MPIPAALSRAVLLSSLGACAALSSLKTTRCQGVVRDIAAPSANQRNGSPRDFVTLRGVSYFVATDAFGAELWRSDGTSAGSYRLKDVAPGTASSNPRSLTVAGDHVFFLATVDGYGTELWATNGTAAGTRLMRDMQTARNGNSWLGPMIAFKKKLYFRAFGDAAGIELWESDGTPAGTKRVADIRSGAAPSLPDNFAVMGGKLYFSASDSRGIELWESDGTSAGTRLLADIGTGGTSSSPLGLTAAGNRLYFSAIHPTQGRELFVSDGTTAGTRLVRDVFTGSASSNPTNLAPLGNGVAFVADDGTHGREPWFSDGSAAGTRLLRDIVPGRNSSTPRALTHVNGRIYFAAFEAAAGIEPWVSDGTPAGTRRLLYIYTGSPSSTPSGFAPAFGGAVFVASQADGIDYWKSDGTANGTVRVRAFPRINVRSVHPSGSGLLLAADSPFGRELFASDGTAAGTRFLVDCFPPRGDSSPSTLREQGGKLFFSASTASLGAEPWISDGTQNGTSNLKDLASGAAGSLLPTDESTRWRGEVFFAARTNATGTELFRSDGTGAGTKLAVDLNSGTRSAIPRRMAPGSTRLYFTATDGLGGENVFAFDGTRATKLTTSSRGSSTTEIEILGDKAYFDAFDASTGKELWVTDGSLAGTRMLVDLRPGATPSNPRELTALGTKLYFSAAGSLGGNDVELHVTDGTAAGTRKLVDLWPGPAGSSPTRVTAVGNRIFFFARTPATGFELFVSDGTAAGTRLTRDINPGTGNADIRDLVGVNGRVFFFCNDGTHGYELWTSDGTTAGTRLARDLMPGAGDGVVLGSLRRLTGTSLVVFAGKDGFDGLQAWRSDGSFGGTVQLGRIGPRRGSGAAVLEDLTPIGATLYCECDDGQLGRELWGIPLASGGTAFAETYGPRCQGTNRLDVRIAANGLPALGKADFAVDLIQGRANSVGLLNLGVLPTQLPLPGGCALALNVPFSLLLSTPTDTNGFARTVLPIPNDASLAGGRAYLQYFVFDQGAPLLGLLTLSDGLAIRLGR